MAEQRINLILSDEDQRMLEQVRMRYGFSTASEAIRFSLRMMAQAEVNVSVDISMQDERTSVRPLPGIKPN